MTRWHGTASETGLRGADRANRAHRARIADHARQLAIGPRLAGRNAAQRAPDALLERRAAQVERQVEACFGSSRNASTARTASASAGIVGNDPRPRKTLAQIAQQRIVRFGEADEADALVGGADQQPPEWAVGESGTDQLALTAPTRGPRRHAQQFAGLFVDPAL